MLVRITAIFPIGSQIQGVDESHSGLKCSICLGEAAQHALPPINGTENRPTALAEMTASRSPIGPAAIASARSSQKARLLLTGSGRPPV
jgi:hypothetical protein